MICNDPFHHLSYNSNLHKYRSADLIEKIAKSEEKEVIEAEANQK